MLLISTALNAAGIAWGLPSMLGWAADELTPMRVLGGLRQDFAGGWHDPYPPFHFYVLAAAFAPALAVDGRPLGEIAAPEAGWRRLRGDGAYLALFLGGRLVSLLMAVGTLLAVHRAGSELFGRAAGVWAAVVMALSLPFVYYAKVANVDLPFTFWFAWSLVAYLRILRAHRPRDYLLFALTGTLSVCTKDQAYGLLVLPAAHVLAALAREAGGRRAVLGDRRFLGAAAVAASAFVLGQGIAINPEGFRAHLEVLTGPMNRSLQMFDRDAAGYLGLLGLTGRLLLFCLGLPAALAAAAGAVLAWRRGERYAVLVVLLPVLSYVAFFLCAAVVAYDRYLMPVCVCLALLAGDFLARPSAGRAGLARAAVGAAVVLWGLARAVAVDLAMVRDARYTAEAWLAAHVPPGASLAVSGPLTHLPRLHGHTWVQRPRLEGAQAPFVVLTVDSARAARGRAGSEPPPEQGLARDYEVAFRHRTPAPWPLDLGFWIRGLEPYTNLHKVSPEVVVLRRRG